MKSGLTAAPDCIRATDQGPHDMPSHKLDYEILGGSAQAVEITLDPGETVIAEAGVMICQKDGGTEPRPFLFASVHADLSLTPLRVAIDLNPLDAEPVTEGFPAGLLILFQSLVKMQDLAAVIAVNHLDPVQG